MSVHRISFSLIIFIAVSDPVAFPLDVLKHDAQKGPLYFKKEIDQSKNQVEQVISVAWHLIQLLQQYHTTGLYSVWNMLYMKTCGFFLVIVLYPCIVFLSLKEKVYTFHD